jgi:hypothetical protein
MDFLLEALTNWLKEMLVGGIMSNLSGMFDSVNQQVADISVQVGQTPQGWNGSIFSMIENLSNSIMVPIAGVILAIVMTVDLIQMIADKNNLHDRVFCEGGFSNTSNINDGQLICGRMKPTHTEGGTPLLYMNKRL